MPSDNIIEYIKTQDAISAAQTGDPAVWVEDRRGDYGVFEYELSEGGSGTYQFWFYNRILGWMKGESAALVAGKKTVIFFTAGRTWAVTVPTLTGTITGYCAFVRDQRER